MGAEASFGHALFFLFWVAILVIPFWKIALKAGYSGWTSLLVVVPLVNLGWLYFLAFSTWPSAKSTTSKNG